MKNIIDEEAFLPPATDVEIAAMVARMRHSHPKLRADIELMRPCTDLTKVNEIFDGILAEYRRDPTATRSSFDICDIKKSLEKIMLDEKLKETLQATIAVMPAEEKALLKTEVGDIIDQLENNPELPRGMQAGYIVADDAPFTEPDLLGAELVGLVADTIEDIGVHAIGVQTMQRVGTIPHAKSMPILMEHVMQARQPGRNIDLTRAITSDILSPNEMATAIAAGVGAHKRSIASNGRVVEHMITSAKSKHYLNAAAGMDMFARGVHQFISIKFYGDPTEYEIEHVRRLGHGALLFTLSGDRVINVGTIDRHNTCLLLQNAKVETIKVKSSRS